MVETMSTTARKRVYTPEQRAAQAEYIREYRRRNPERVRQWRQNYILRAAARLQAEAEARDGDSGGRA